MTNTFFENSLDFIAKPRQQATTILFPRLPCVEEAAYIVYAPNGPA
jgi:hypothetical protein